MISFHPALLDPAWTNFVFTLLHSLWQGALVAIGLWWLLHRIPAARTELRYGVSLAAQALLVTGVLIAGSILNLEVGDGPTNSPTLTSLSVSDHQAQPSVAMAAIGKGMASPWDRGATAPSSRSEMRPPQAPAWISWVVMAWFAGVAGMLARLLAQWVDWRRVRRICRPLHDSAIEAVCQRLQLALGMRRRVMLMTCERITTPAVFGAILPKILLPAAILAGIPVAQLEAILAHELSHIRRHDFLVNLLQGVIEALLFFNPAVWWINRQIRAEREACCDRLAVAAIDNPAEYAQALLYWAERRSAGMPGLAPAFGAPAPSGGLLDRLKRIIVAGYRPAIRLPWYSCLGLLLLAGGLYLGLWQSTKMAVGLAAGWLSPEKRMQEIARIQNEFGQRPNGVDEPAQPRKIWVRGTLVNGDGALLSTDAWGELLVQSGISSSGSSVYAREGRFEYQVQPGRLYAAFFPSNAAPAFIGPVELTSDGEPPPLKILVEDGFSARIRFEDEAGKPVSAVRLDFKYQHRSDVFVRPSLRSHEDGEVIMEHIGSPPLELKAVKEGYESAQRGEVRLKSEEILIWKLRRAISLSGQVVSRENHAAIPAAEIRMVSLDGPARNTWGMFDGAPVLGQTDASGRFTLATLNRDWVYGLAVLASNCAPAVICGVYPGPSDLRIELSPAIHLRGRVVGDLSRLETPRPTVRMVWFVDLGPTFGRHGRAINLPLDIREGVGYFEATNVMPGKVEFVVAGLTREIDIDRSRDDLTIELKDAAADGAPISRRREVVIEVKVPPGHPLPNGAFEYNYWSDGDRRGQIAQGVLSNGMARISIPAPGGVMLSSTAIKGYWIEMTPQPVAEGTDPFPINVSGIPAGAIYGTVRDENGADTGGVMVSLVEVEKSPLKKSEGSLGVEPKSSASSDDNPTRFVAQPLPLKGKYRIVAHRNHTYVASPVVTLTQEQPLREIDLRLVSGVSVEGRVVDGQNRPMARAEVLLTFESSPSHHFGSSPVLSDTEGRFRFKGVNPKIPGRYFITAQHDGFQTVTRAVDFRNAPLQLALPPGMTLRGVVLDEASGLPIPEARIYAMADPGVRGERLLGGLPTVETDASGRFQFANLAERTYRLGVRGAQTQQAAVNRLYRAGGIETVTLRVTPYDGNRTRLKQ